MCGGMALCVHLCCKVFKSDTGRELSVSIRWTQPPRCKDNTVYSELVEARLGREWTFPERSSSEEAIVGRTEPRVSWAG